MVYSMVMSRRVEHAPDELPCARCNQMKPIKEFPIVVTRGHRYYWSYCLTCRNTCQRDRRKALPEEQHAYDNSYYYANKDRILANARRYRTPEKQRALTLKKLYRITPDDYDNLLEKQGGVCAICGNPPQGKRKFLAVDHNHDTGEIRGLLCTTCNVGLGALGDSIELLRAALTYLERTGDQK